MINGVTFDAQLVTSAAQAHLNHVYGGKQSGITKGCGMTVRGNDINIEAGSFIVCGRLVQLTGTTIVECPAVTDRIFAVLVFEIDLTKTNTDDAFNQGYFRILTGTTTYPQTIQSDLDDGGMLYQMEFARFIVDGNGIGSFADVRNEFVAASGKMAYCTLFANAWSAVAPYTQRVSVPGMRSDSTPGWDINTQSKDATYLAQLQDAVACITYIETENGAINAVCATDKPIADIPLFFKGV